MKSPINTVANKTIITLDIATWIPSNEEIYVLDLKQFLYKELILKEEDYKLALSNFNWSDVKDKYVMITCSNLAIIPTWAYMLLSQNLNSISSFYAFAKTAEEFKNLVLLHKINEIDLSTYENQRIVIKGCGDKTISENIYLTLTAKLAPVARAISYGEPCSMVPVYRKKVD